MYIMCMMIIKIYYYYAYIHFYTYFYSISTTFSNPVTSDLHQSVLFYIAPSAGAKAIFRRWPSSFQRTQSVTQQPKDSQKELFKQCRPDVRRLAAEGHKQCRLKARREWKLKNLDLKP